MIQRIKVIDAQKVVDFAEEKIKTGFDFFDKICGGFKVGQIAVITSGTRRVENHAHNNNNNR